MGFKHDDVPFRGTCKNCRQDRKRCNVQPSETCERCRTNGLICIKEQRKKTGRPSKTSKPNDQKQLQLQQRHPSQSPASDLQPRFPAFASTPESLPASSATTFTTSTSITPISSSSSSNQKERIGLPEDTFQELEDAFTVRSSWTDDTEMLDLLMEEEEKEQEQYLIDVWQKRPP